MMPFEEAIKLSYEQQKRCVDLKNVKTLSYAELIGDPRIYFYEKGQFYAYATHMASFLQKSISKAFWGTLELLFYFFILYPFVIKPYVWPWIYKTLGLGNSQMWIDITTTVDQIVEAVF